MQARLADLERRLARAERDGRALRRATRTLCGLCLALLVGMFTLVTAKPAITQTGANNRVRAPFIVTDAANKPMIEVSSDDDGPFIRLYNKAGREVGLWFADKDGGNLGLANPQGKPVALLFADEDGGNLGLSDNDGKQSAGLVSTKDGGRIDVFDKAGNVVFRRP